MGSAGAKANASSVTFPLAIAKSSGDLSARAKRLLAGKSPTDYSHKVPIG
jgi:hypothetical protein